MTNNVKNLADLLALVAETNLPPTRKRDTLSAIRKVAAVLGASPEVIPLDLKLLRQRLGAILPESLGVSRRRWNNVKALFRGALELTMPLMPSTQKAPLSPAWASLLALRPPADRHCLGALSRFLSSRGIEPASVTLPDLEAFRVAITENRLRAKPEKTWEILSWCWNRVARLTPGWPQIFIPRQDQRIRYILPWNAFPASFEADVRAYLKRLSGDDFDDDEGPRRPLRPISLAEREYQLRAGGSALAAAGVLPEEITSISCIARHESIKRIAFNLLNRGDGEHWMAARNMAKTLRAAAKHWVKVDQQELTKIDTFMARKLPRQQIGMTEKNAERLRPFDDPQFVSDFLQLPFKLAGQLRKKTKKTVVDAVIAQNIVAIAILQVAPIRIRNLSTLDLEKDLILRGNALYIEIERSQVKNNQPILHEVPPDVVELIQWYVLEFRDLLIDTQTNALFPGEGGKPKSRKTLGMQISRLIRKHLGKEIHPHLFRHAAAKIYLDSRPGEYPTVSRLLGHSTLATAMQSYTGSERVSASRHYQGVVQEAREKLVRPAGRRGGK
jgi:integrase